MDGESKTSSQKKNVEMFPRVFTIRYGQRAQSLTWSALINEKCKNKKKNEKKNYVCMNACNHNTRFQDLFPQVDKYDQSSNLKL